MKKNLFKLLFLGLGIMFLTTQCKDDATTEVKSAVISGIVSTDAAGVAAGAVVSLSTTANAADIVATAIADSAGAYTFNNIAKGKYYISAVYNTQNTNLLKAGEIGIVFKTAGDTEITVDGIDATQNLSLVSDASDGGMVIDFTDAAWSCDITHSSVGFNFTYDSLGSDFYGHFSLFTIENLKFDESNPANTAFTIKVDMTSVETGASSANGGHGRDGVTGCIAKTLGVTFVDTVGMTSVQKDAYRDSYGAFTLAAVTNNSNIATYTVAAGGVEAYGNGYVAHGTLTFRGATQDVDYFFQYREGYQAVKTGINYNYNSIIGFMKINAKADYGVVSGHIKGSPVTIVANMEFVQNLGAAVK